MRHCGQSEERTEFAISDMRHRLRHFILLPSVALIAVLISARPLHAQAAPASSTVSAASRLEDRTFSSTSLSRSMTYRVLLPAAYFSASQQRFPVLYLLHGWAGDYKNWSTLTKLSEYAKELPLIVVMPDAGNSWYVDSSLNPQDKFEQYVVRDLIEDVDHHFRTVPDAQHRAVAGLSMGGYGAVKFALKYPQTFGGIAASLSGAFNASTTELERSRPDLSPSLLQAFGAATSEQRSQDSLEKLILNAKPGAVAYLYISCGTGDEFLEPNRKIAAALSKQKLKYEYHEYPGAHSWDYWDQNLPAVLKIAMQSLGDGASTKN